MLNLFCREKRKHDDDEAVGVQNIGLLQVWSEDLTPMQDLIIKVAD